MFKIKLVKYLKQTKKRNADLMRHIKLLFICNRSVCLSLIRERRRFAPSRQAHASQKSAG